MKHVAAVVAGLLMSFPATAEELAGMVREIYYEAGPGILLQWRPRMGSARRWADVDVDGRRVLARVPDDMRVSPGHGIAVVLGAPKSMPLAQALPMTAVSRAVALDSSASVGR
jgi:hypothetical protein